MVITNSLIQNIISIQTQILLQLIPYTNLKTKNFNPRYPHPHNYYLISFLFKEKENDGDDMTWIS
jgi:hypothetical protein